MRNKPAPNQQPHRGQHRPNSQPIPPPPPNRQKETHANHDTRNLARDDVEPCEGEQGANERRPQVACREGESLATAFHAGNPAFVGVEGDREDAAAGKDAGYGVTELVECDD